VEYGDVAILLIASGAGYVELTVASQDRDRSRQADADPGARWWRTPSPS